MRAAPIHEPPQPSSAHPEQSGAFPERQRPGKHLRAVPDCHDGSANKTYLANLDLVRSRCRSPHLDGCVVVECGTWRGGMSAGLIEVLGRNRHYHFFDSFEGLPPAKEIDGADAIRWQSDTDAPRYFDNCTASEGEFRATIKLTGIEGTNVHVYPGPFSETLSHSDTGPIALLQTGR